MRIAILTFHRAYNCGAMLQAWALKTVLERMGHIVEFPICNHVGERKRWHTAWTRSGTQGLRWVKSLVGRSVVNLLSIPNEDLLRYRYTSFRRRNLPERICSPNDFAEHYDLVIVGSDQVWNAKITEQDAPVFFGENLPVGVRRIAYAASCGDNPLMKDEIGRVVRALENFDEVSVRERSAKDQLVGLSNRSIQETADPTLLLEANDYDMIANGSIPTVPYLFMYTLSATDFFVNSARAISRKLGVKCIVAPCYQYSRYGALRGLTYGLSPDRLVQYVRHAKYVLAGSFHGTVMGALFNKPFLSFRKQVDEFESRPAALLRKLGCLDRLVTPLTSTDEMCQRLTAPLADFRPCITVMRQESLQWLKDAITG